MTRKPFHTEITETTFHLFFGSSGAGHQTSEVAAGHRAHPIGRNERAPCRGVGRGGEAPRSEPQRKTTTTPKNEEPSRGNGRMGTVEKGLPGGSCHQAELLPGERLQDRSSRGKHLDLSASSHSPVPYSAHHWLT